MVRLVDVQPPAVDSCMRLAGWRRGEGRGGKDEDVMGFFATLGEIRR